MQKITVFTAAWCGPCKQLKAHLDTWQRANGRVLIEYVDIEEQPEVASRHDVRAVPAVFVDGTRLPAPSVAGVMQKLTSLASERKPL